MAQICKRPPLERLCFFFVFSCQGAKSTSSPRGSCTRRENQKKPDSGSWRKYEAYEVAETLYEFNSLSGTIATTSQNFRHHRSRPRYRGDGGREACEDRSCRQRSRRARLRRLEPLRRPGALRHFDPFRGPEKNILIFQKKKNCWALRPMESL